MGRVEASIEVPGRASEAENLWYDTRRWPAFVDGLVHVLGVDEGWPAQRGARVRWTTSAGGRGHVAEEVVEHEPRVGQTLRVEDEHLRGTQRVSFEAIGTDRTKITLALDYEIKRERGVKPVVDWLFVRRPVRDSLRRTLSRFARELRDEREGL